MHMPHSLCESQPQENCNADELINQFLSEMDAETSVNEEDEGAEMDEAGGEIEIHEGAACSRPILF